VNLPATFPEMQSISSCFSRSGW